MKNHHPPSLQALRDKGDLRKERGMSVAALNRPERVDRGAVAFLDALLRAPDGIATIDDATLPDDLAGKFADGGKWRGTVPRLLALAGIIERLDVVRSDRPARHRGYVTRWRLINRAKAVAMRARLTSRFPIAIGFASELKKSEPAPAATGTGSIESSPQATNKEGQKTLWAD